MNTKSEISDEGPWENEKREKRITVLIKILLSTTTKYTLITRVICRH